jgi:hypothetical protein
MTETLTITRPEYYLLFDLRSAQEYFTHGDITIAGDGLQNLGLWLCLALRVFEHSGKGLYRVIPFVTESQFFLSRSCEFKDRPHSYGSSIQSPRTTHKALLRDYSDTDHPGTPNISF